MSRFQRTTKNLAQRIDMHYFQLPHPARRRRLRLCVAIPTLAALWVAWRAFPKESREALSNPGPLSRAHALFSQRCELCHESQTAAFRKRATDNACMSCHDGPTHNPGQVFTPHCATCHQEHHHNTSLSAVRDASCTQCHARLRTQAGPTSFRSVNAFRGREHPEFIAKLPSFRDPGTIKFSHQVHMDTLQCDSCHAPASQNDSPTVQEARLGVGGSLPPSARVNFASGAFMAPIKFADHCAACHSDKLEFDKRILDSVPHDTPEVIHAAILKHAPANNKLVADLESALWQEKCAYCHTLTFGDGELPKVVSSSIPQRWFFHASFSHVPHKIFACQGCHTKAASSKAASDILLPGTADCQQCHRPGGFASSDCYVCHSYHDWRNRKPRQVTFDISCLLRKGSVESCKSPTEDQPQK